MYNLKIIRSGKRLELYKINDYAIRQKGDIEKPERESKERKEPGKQSSKDRKQTLNNARNDIIRLIKSNEDMRTFITLTFAKETDYKESKKYLNNLFNKLRRDYTNLKYLWVLEYGDKNNRLHYHLLCNIPIEIKLSSSNEKKSIDHKKFEQSFSKKYWKYGFVDIRELNQEGNTNIALYVSAYITKSMQDKDLEGYRIYSYSKKTLNKPIEEFFYTRNSLEEVLEEFKEYNIKFSNSYPIGYTDYKGDHTGSVTYIDLEYKE